MTGLDPTQFREHVIRPTLGRLDMWSMAAEQLLLGTALVESGLFSLVQTNGPALGVYQIEPETHDDIWSSYLVFREPLRAQVENLLAPSPSKHRQLVSNLAYSTAMARLVYWRKSEPLPKENDALEMSLYWRRHYNTEEGKGRPQSFRALFNRFVK